MNGGPRIMNTAMRKMLIGAVALSSLFAAQARPVSAAVVTLTTSEQGWIFQNDADNGTSNTNNYILGNCPTPTCDNQGTNEGEFRDFFGFTIPALSGNVTSAILEINTFNAVLSQSP